MEIYNEELGDLLSSKKQKLAILEGKNGPVCRGLSQVVVKDADDLLQKMKQAQNQRQVGETNMNQASSRSHCICTIQVEATKQINDGTTLQIHGKLHCVDLAGSECAKSANIAGGEAPEVQAARERERMNINRSLLTLGRVIKMLKDISQNPKKAGSIRIPYR